MAHLVPGSLLHHRYRILQPLGSGSSARALLAHDLLLDRTVAVKALLPESDLLLALRQEFSILRGLAHPHLLRVHDFAIAWIGGQRTPFYTADVVPGSDLASFCQRISWTTALRPLGHVLSALSQLHELGVRHGDVKPENILVREDGRAVLIDLSCAASLTQTGAAPSGTPDYWAPEILRGHADARSDLFAFGIMLQRLIPLLRSPIPVHVHPIIDVLTRPDPRERPPSAIHVAEALRAPEVPRGSPSGDAPRLVGRAEPVDRFREALDALLANRPFPRSFCVRGGDGMGKSRMLRELTWDAQMRCEVLAGHARTRAPVTSLLLRASDGPASGQAPLDLWTSLRDQGPKVLVLDDAHLLNESERLLLDACLRTSSPSDRVLWVLSADGQYDAPAAVTIDLAPLTIEDLDVWTSGRLMPQELRRFASLSGGCPAIVRALSPDAIAGRLSGDDVSSLVEDRVIKRLDSLDHSARRALAAIAVLRRSFGDDWLACFAIAPDSIASLERGSWIQQEDDGYRLAREAEAAAVLRCLPARLISEVRDRIRTELERRIAVPGAAPQETVALWVEQLADTGHAGSALDALSAHCPEDHPAVWRRAVSKVARTTGALRARWLDANLTRLTDGPAAATAQLARILRERPNVLWSHLCWCEAAEVSLRLARFARARRQLLRAEATSESGDDRARVADLRARISVQEGAYARARDMARGAMAEAHDSRLRASLHETIALTSSYLGEREVAEDQLRLAEELRQRVGPPSAVARLRCYQALHAYRGARLEEAARRYDEALVLAEQHGSRDLLASTALNLATVHHQSGAWAKALAAYDRAAMLARALNKPSTASTVQWNQAKLYADIGAFDQAERSLEAVVQGAAGTGIGELDAIIASLRGEIALARGALDSAAQHLADASARYLALDTERDRVEAELQLAEVDLLAGRVEAARRRVAALPLPDSAPVDLLARRELIAGRISIAEGKLQAATESFEVSLRHAESCGMMHLQAEVLESLGAVWESRGAATIGADYRARSRRLWERVAADLPQTLRDVFWAHPRRRTVSAEAPTNASSRGTLPSPVRRLLAINRRLSSTLDTAEVLDAAMDAAMELTGAERGFLLLADGGLLRVAVARNLDRDRVEASDADFSRGIAQRVLTSGEPVLTIDALSDDRFRSNASVHAMHLRSVVCVPVRSASGGALYLDHRYRPGCFHDDDLEMLLAFADQVGIALRNAALHAEVKAQTQELADRQARIEELVREQADEIDRLEERVRASDRTRRGYADIVGSSRAMQDVYAVLERVVEATVPVVVRGESGTGKELVARAIHGEGPRRRGPFVSINCGALPDALLESELFGHVRGAFTGAVRDRAGLFVAARGGTLFLDEVGDMSPAMQVKLLRVLQEHEVRPVGSNASTAVDVRLVCATHRDLRTEVAAGRFREDLFYRIAVIEVVLPPLRDRAEDVPLLAEHLLERAARGQGRDPAVLTERAMRKLVRYRWPGNVRQLDNVLLKAMVLAPGDRIDVSAIDLPLAAVEPQPVVSRANHRTQERQRILDALNACGWNASEASRSLGMPRTTFYRKLGRYGIGRGE